MSVVIFSGCRIFVPWMVNGRFAQGFCPCCHEYSLFNIGGAAYCVVCAGGERKPLSDEEMSKFLEFRNSVREEISNGS